MLLRIDDDTEVLIDWAERTATVRQVGHVVEQRVPDMPRDKGKAWVETGELRIEDGVQAKPGHVFDGCVFDFETLGGGIFSLSAEGEIWPGYTYKKSEVNLREYAAWSPREAVTVTSLDRAEAWLIKRWKEDQCTQ